MFLLFVIVLFAAEVAAFVAVGHAIGWLWTVLLLFGTSLVGWQVLRIQGRAAIERVSRAVSERGAPGRAALDGVLGFIGGVMLVVPGFVTDAVGVLLLLGPTRALVRRSISRRYAGRVVRFASATGRFTPGGWAARPADVESTAVEDDLGRLER
jgi:UPF0716 protein FxsA